MSKFPTMHGRNKELFDAAIALGKVWTVTRGLNFFVNPDGSYFGFPLGFITGPHYSNNGSPRPYSISVNGPDGWYQRSAPAGEIDDLKLWAIEKQDQILAQRERNQNQ